MPTIIIVCGLARSGKDAFAEHLVERYGFFKYVFSDVLRRELEQRGAAVSKQAMADLGAGLRAEHGLEVVAARLMQGVDLRRDAVLVGPRNIEEVEFVRKKARGAVLVRIDAPKETRYARRSGLDAQQIGQFFRRDEEDLAEKGMGKVLKAADFVIGNYGTLEEFWRGIDEFMQSLTDAES